MATYTSNYNLEKPEATDPFGDFRQSYNSNMNIIDANLGGGGGSGGHTILDPDGNSLPQENALQFTGAVSVSDDNVNGRTVVDIKGGNVYGAFVDTSRVIASGTWAGSLSYVATDDCFVFIDGDLQNSHFVVNVDGVKIFDLGSSTYVEAMRLFPLKKGQTLTATRSTNYDLNYIVYGITQGTNGIFAPVIYSDNERVIGVWRDNKPLYQRTFVLSSTITVSGSGTLLPNDIQTALADVEIMVDSECARDSTYSAFISPYVYKSGGQWYILSADNWGNVKFITLRYTKTTDVAGSGNWNTDGVPTVHYSTSEQVIGTWIDGKPLYQRSYKHTLANTPDEDTESFYVGDVPSDIDTLVKMDGTVKSPNAYAFCSTTGLPYVVGWNYSFHLNPSNHLAVWSTGNYSYYQHIAGGVAVVTIQYTKTTD